MGTVLLRSACYFSKETSLQKIKWSFKVLNALGDVFYLKMSL